MTVLRVDTISGIGSDGPVFDGDLEFNSQNYVILPKGTTGDRVGLGSTAGALRYNTDSNKVELYDGSQWAEVQSSRPDLNGGARGVFGGGAATPTYVNNIEYINIQSTGNAIDFGDMSGSVRAHNAACSSATRGLFGGGYTATPGATTNTIDYITISSTGDAVDFGDLTVIGRGFNAACSSSTRGLFAGGRDGGTLYNIIDYVTTASTGNAVDFGALSQTKRRLSALSSPTRGVFGAGTTGSNTNVIEFVTISTLGNAQDFGDLIAAANTTASCSSPTRGLFAGGFAPSFVNTIQYITIATTGNAVNFGSLTTTPANLGACSSPTRGVFGGGYTPTLINNIEYVTIQNQGNSVDFGDLIVARQPTGSCSNAHGGL